MFLYNTMEMCLLDYEDGTHAEPLKVYYHLLFRQLSKTKFVAASCNKLHFPPFPANTKLLRHQIGEGCSMIFGFLESAMFQVFVTHDGFVLFFCMQNLSITQHIKYMGARL